MRPNQQFISLLNHIPPPYEWPETPLTGPWMPYADAGTWLTAYGNNGGSYWRRLMFVINSGSVSTACSLAGGRNIVGIDTYIGLWSTYSDGAGVTNYEVYLDNIPTNNIDTERPNVTGRTPNQKTSGTGASGLSQSNYPDRGYVSKDFRGRFQNNNNTSPAYTFTWDGTSHILVTVIIKGNYTPFGYSKEFDPGISQTYSTCKITESTVESQVRDNTAGTMHISYYEPVYKLYIVP